MTNSQWDNVSELMQSENRIQLSQPLNRLFRQDPERVLQYLSLYKFAAKLILQQKRILDLGCGDGLGSWILATECGGPVLGTDPDAQLIAQARRNWQDDRISFSLGEHPETNVCFDAIVCLSGFFAAAPAGEPSWWAPLFQQLSADGLVLLGWQRQDQDKLRQMLSGHFHRIFDFACLDEVVLAGRRTEAPYQLALACLKR